METVGSTPEELTAVVKADMARFGRMLDAGARRRRTRMNCGEDPVSGAPRDISGATTMIKDQA